MIIKIDYLVIAIAFSILGGIVATDSVAWGYFLLSISLYMGYFCIREYEE